MPGFPGLMSSTRRGSARIRRACRRAPGVSALARPGAFTTEHGERATLALLAEARPPTEIIAGSNLILVGVQRAGFSFPRDVSVVTCDEVLPLDLTQPPLATISRDPQDMAMSRPSYCSNGSLVASLAPSCCRRSSGHETGWRYRRSEDWPGWDWGTSLSAPWLVTTPINPVAQNFRPNHQRDQDLESPFGLKPGRECGFKGSRDHNR